MCLYLFLRWNRYWCVFAQCLGMIIILTDFVHFQGSVPKYFTYRAKFEVRTILCLSSAYYTAGTGR